MVNLPSKKPVDGWARPKFTRELESRQSFTVSEFLPERLRSSLLSYRVVAYLSNKKALWVGLWFAVALWLASRAFGFGNIVTGGVDLIAVTHTPNARKILAFAALGMMIVFGMVWFWREIRKRNTFKDIAFLLIYSGISVGLLLIATRYYRVHFGTAATWFLWLYPPFSIFTALNIRHMDPPPYRPPPAPPAIPRYTRREDSIYGDARHSDDWEVDEALRDKTGGFDPMFKD